jgi:threonine aldolase
MDGSRISNAAAALGLPIKSITADLGVDALSFGGTKNGLLIGEAVIFFKKPFAEDFPYVRKQNTQLYSKDRFIAAQFIAYLKDDLNLRLARHSNEMAKYLEYKLQGINEVKISRPVMTNAVFAIIPEFLSNDLMSRHNFSVWNEATNEVRWMCSFNTAKEDVDNFVRDIKQSILKYKP